MDHLDPAPDLSAEDAAASIDRREFLQLMATSFAALGVAGCEFDPPDEKVIPFLVAPEEVKPGQSLWYATTCDACPSGCGLLVKNRDGRPIKIEGNPDHPLTKGGVCARGQAQILDLYDSHRLRGPLSGGEKAPGGWRPLDAGIQRQLATVEANGKAIRILTRTVNSPSLANAIAQFASAFPSTVHVEHEPLAPRAILEAHRLSHGEALVPWYRFEKARTIVSFDADFLGTWISPVEFAKGWAVGRRMDAEVGMSWHAQFEAHLSPTGAKADLRRAVAPSQLFRTALEVARRVGAARLPEAAAKLPAPDGEPPIEAAVLDRVASELLATPGRSLVVSGSEDIGVQLLVNFINHALDGYGATLDLSQPSLQHPTAAATVDELIDEMEAGKVGALIVLDANPVYDHPRGPAFAAAVGQVGLTVSLTGRTDETTKGFLCNCPDHHPLETWRDAHPHYGLYSLFQPLIKPLFDTRSAIESLVAFTGKRTRVHDYVRDFWRDNVFGRLPARGDFETFWTSALHDGFLVLESERLEARTFGVRALDDKAIQVRPVVGGEENGYEPAFFASVSMGDGRQANNPYLQELPDPITRTTWENVAVVSPKTARRMKVVDGRVIAVTAGERKIELPVVVQPGVAEGVVAIALGYGRTEAGPIAANYPTVKVFAIEQEPAGGANAFSIRGARRVEVAGTQRMSRLARVQTFDYQTTPLTGHDRQLARSTTAEAWRRDPASGNPPPEFDATLWPKHEYTGRKWEMSIDLNACTGCAGCVVACSIENNVPVVGKAEIAKSRDLHWLRIDRYYDGTAAAPPDEPEVSFQPMLCHHCDNAPCETVCPVLATAHSAEGLNMQVYNRCVGTRYCANNCPYKVRRFNWFDYAHEDLVQNLVLNPDVTVRTRGIMEKCSFCVQRIHEGRATAKGEDRPIADGEIQPACAQSCPTDAIVFGDGNDPTSRVARRKQDPRRYGLLTDLGVGPAVHYLTQVRNQKDGDA